MCDVFNDPYLDAEFKEYGFVVLRGELEMDFKNAYKYFNTLNSQVDNSFYTALWSPDTEHRRAVNDKAREVLMPVCKKYLKAYRPLIGDLLVKRPSMFKKVTWHQDWTYVDERQYASVFMWAPLQHVTKRNGALMFLPKSHKYFRSIRGTNIDPVLKLGHLNRLRRSHNRYVEMKRGDVLVFNQATVHASPPNRSLKNRLALGLHCVPEAAELYHYHYDFERKKYLQYQVDLDFVLHFSDGQDFKENMLSNRMPRPRGRVLRESDTLNEPFGPEIYSAYDNATHQ